MKDIIISGRAVRRELFTMLFCFIVAFLTNVGAILYYHRPWVEVFSQIGFVLVLALCVYLFLGMFRVAWFVSSFFFKNVFKNKK